MNPCAPSAAGWLIAAFAALAMAGCGVYGKPVRTWQSSKERPANEDKAGSAGAESQPESDAAEAAPTADIEDSPIEDSLGEELDGD